MYLLHVQFLFPIVLSSLHRWFPNQTIGRYQRTPNSAISCIWTPR